MAATRPALCALALFLLVSSAAACVHVYGNRDEAGRLAGGHYTYSYNGLDWGNDFEQCRGEKQSPVLLPGMGYAAATLPAPSAKSSFSYGVLQNTTVLNNGHTLLITIPPEFQSNVTIPVRGDPATVRGTSIVDNTTAGATITYVKATPVQFHFHTHSEHYVSGAEYPLEMHIVHFIKKDQLPACGDAGCAVVLGIMLALTTDESAVSPELRKVINAMPLNEGMNATASDSVDIGALLPANRSYFTYEGSLTTPPCSEGILWHVLTTPVYISQTLLTRYQAAVGNYNCPDEDDDDPNSDWMVTTPEVTSADGVQNGESTSAVQTIVFTPPKPDEEGCTKLADGHNYRAVQPLNGRTIHLAV